MLGLFSGSAGVEVVVMMTQEITIAIPRGPDDPFNPAFPGSSFKFIIMTKSINLLRFVVSYFRMCRKLDSN